MRYALILKTVIGVWTAMLFSACGSMSYLTIETYNPAEITFPDGVNRVLVVNNAVAQSPATGYEYSLMGVKQDTCRVHADSALFDASQYLGKAIVEVNYFEDVLFYHLPTREDDNFLFDGKLTPSQVGALCEETGTDAVISFDRLLFTMDKNIQAFSGGYLQGTVRVDIRGVARAYVPERETPLATIVVTDSLRWEEYADDKELLDAFLPAADEALRICGKYIGTALHENFVPHWQEEMRWYYKGINSAWKEATAFAVGEKWDLASERWEKIYNRSSGNAKAKAASNLAIAAEMKGDFEKAHTWATQARDLFQQIKGSDAQETKLQEVYLEVLQGRIIKDRKLNVQFGED